MPNAQSGSGRPLRPCGRRDYHNRGKPITPVPARGSSLSSNTPIGASQNPASIGSSTRGKARTASHSKEASVGRQRARLRNQRKEPHPPETPASAGQTNAHHQPRLPLKHQKAPGELRGASLTQVREPAISLARAWSASRFRDRVCPMPAARAPRARCCFPDWSVRAAAQYRAEGVPSHGMLRSACGLFARRMPLRDGGAEHQGGRSRFGTRRPLQDHEHSCVIVEFWPHF